ncbi:MAG: hypothetical protein ACKVPX_10345 [Myxococcaceae bacterium]
MRFGDVMRCVLALVVLAGGVSHAGVRYTLTSDQRKTVVSSDGQRLRVERSGSETPTQIIIVDGVDKRVTLLDPNKKTFTEFNFEAMRQAVVQRPSPPTGSPTQASDTSEKFTDLQKPSQVVGRVCRFYQGHRAGKLFLEACFAPWRALRLSPEVFAPLMMLAESIPMGATFEKAAPAKLAWDKLPGFPVHSTTYSPLGNRIEEERLTRVAYVKVPLRTFRVPADYQRVATTSETEADGL